MNALVTGTDLGVALCNGVIVAGLSTAAWFAWGMVSGRFDQPGRRAEQ